MFIIPTAIMGVMFPAFSQAIAQDKDRSKRLYKKTIVAVFGILFPISCILIIVAKPGLTIWLGEDFAINSFQVAQILAIGVLISSMAQPSFTFIQASGKPKITAFIHMCELPLYLVCLWFLVKEMSILGAAIAWLIRVSISCGVLTFVATRLLKRSKMSK